MIMMKFEFALDWLCVMLLKAAYVFASDTLYTLDALESTHKQMLSLCSVK